MNPFARLRLDGYLEFGRFVRKDLETCGELFFTASPQAYRHGGATERSGFAQDDVGGHCPVSVELAFPNRDCFILRVVNLILVFLAR